MAVQQNVAGVVVPLPVAIALPAHPDAADNTMVVPVDYTVPVENTADHTVTDVVVERLVVAEQSVGVARPVVRRANSELGIPPN